AVDQMQTGSIAGTGKADPETGTLAFRKALAVLDDDPAAAYQLAKSLRSYSERRAVQWAAIHSGNGAIDHKSVQRFMTEAPDFAKGDVFKMRMEQALLREGASPEVLVGTLSDTALSTVAARLALVSAYRE